MEMPVEVCPVCKLEITKAQMVMSLDLKLTEGVYDGGGFSIDRESLWPVCITFHVECVRELRDHIADEWLAKMLAKAIVFLEKKEVK
jgi:hypothetical protein